MTGYTCPGSFSREDPAPFPPFDAVDIPWLVALPPMAASVVHCFLLSVNPPFHTKMIWWHLDWCLLSRSLTKSHLFTIEDSIPRSSVGVLLPRDCGVSVTWYGVIVQAVFVMFHSSFSPSPHCSLSFKERTGPFPYLLY